MDGLRRLVALAASMIFSPTQNSSRAPGSGPICTASSAMPARMQRLGVSVRIDRDRADAQSPCGADDAAGDLAAIGDQQRLDHLGDATRIEALPRSRAALSPNGLATASSAASSSSPAFGGGEQPVAGEDAVGAGEEAERLGRSRVMLSRPADRRTIDSAAW